MMRHFFLAFLVLLPYLASAQLSDDFSDGDFTANPAWTGHTADYIINANQELQLNATSAGSSYLSTPSIAADNVTWTFDLSMDFNPSSGNRVKVFLMSDEADLSGDLNGYYLQIGETGSADGLNLYRQTGSSSSVILNEDNGIGATSPKLAVKVTRSSDGTWTVMADPDGGTDYQLQGTVKDDTHQTTRHFGVMCIYTATRTDLFSFDDFRIADAPIDLTSASAINATTVEAIFSKEVDPATVSPTRFSIDRGIGMPLSAVLQGDGKTVRLTLGADLVSGSYTLRANSVRAADGSGSIPASTLVTFSYSEPIAPGTLLITEVFADFSPTIGLPEAEYLELYNAGDQVIQISGMIIQDPTGQGTLVSPTGLSTISLDPGQYIIVCEDDYVRDYEAFGKVITATAFPTLNNTTDTLSILDADRRLIDQVAYADDWYGDAEKSVGGWSLERISLNDPCLTGAANWKASIDPSGGTPGRQNSALNNSIGGNAPEVTQVLTQSATSVAVYFDKKMDEDALTNTANYAISGGISVSQALADEGRQKVTLTTSPMTEGVIYEMQLSGLTDCTGLELVTGTQTVGKGASAGAFELLITEIHADPTPVVSLPDAEYIELYNATDRLIDLTGYQLQDNLGRGTFPVSSIPADSYVILCSEANAGLLRSFGQVIALSSFPSLTNSGETLTLLDASGEYIFDITYQDDWHTNSVQADGGYSLEMLDLGAPCAGAENWQSSTDPKGGTPGQINSESITLTDEQAPRLINVVALTDRQVRLRFDEKLGAKDPSSASISIDLGIVIDEVSKAPSSASELLASLANPLSVGTIYTLTVSGLEDCLGNVMGSQSDAFALPERGDSADILINEILFNPPSGGVDFVEVVNVSDKYVSLRGWQLANVVEGFVANAEVVSEELLVIAPGEFLAFTEDTAQLKIQYPAAPSENFVLADLPSYPDTEGSVVLLDSSGRLMDRFDYLDDYHLRLLDDDDGVSLERISTANPTNDANNWASASSTSGYGTPGEANSQTFDGGAPSSQDCFSATPKVITPDLDGLDDYAIITYDCGQTNLVANITIYSADGRPVRQLVQNNSLSTVSNIQWDGTDDIGQRVRLGVYLIFIETFSDDGASQVHKVAIAVGSRR